MDGISNLSPFKEYLVEYCQNSLKWSVIAVDFNLSKKKLLVFKKIWNSIGSILHEGTSLPLYVTVHSRQLHYLREDWKVKNISQQNDW